MKFGIPLNRETKPTFPAKKKKINNDFSLRVSINDSGNAIVTGNGIGELSSNATLDSLCFRTNTLGKNVNRLLSQARSKIVARYLESRNPVQSIAC